MLQTIYWLMAIAVMAFLLFSSIYNHLKLREHEREWKKTLEHERKWKKTLELINKIEDPCNNHITQIDTNLED